MARRAFRLALPAILVIFCAVCAGARETASSGTASATNIMTWRLVNFGIFAIALGFALVKYAPAFFNARSADIQKAINDATGLKMDADLRFNEIDRKMANLAGEVAKLRAQAKNEMDREYERIRRQTQDELAYIQRGTAAEVDALRAEGAAQVRLHTANLAFGLAEKRLRDRFAAAESPEFLEDFLNLVERGKN